VKGLGNPYYSEYSLLNNCLQQILNNISIYSNYLTLELPHLDLCGIHVSTQAVPTLRILPQIVFFSYIHLFWHQLWDLIVVQF